MSIDFETATEHERIKALEELGISLEVVCIDQGGYKKSSVWSVTLKNNGRQYRTTYTRGWGLRDWAKLHNRDRWTAHRLECHIGYKYRRHNKESFQSWVSRCGNLVEDSQFNHPVFDYFNLMTEPVEPNLVDVVYCLYSDANCVRYGQTFEEFCSELGYSDDSIKAKKIYDACLEIWRGLASLGIDLDKLGKITYGY